MKSPLERIKELIPVLPEKDAILADKFLSKRDFQSILELTESDIYKAKKKKHDESDEIPDDYITNLGLLKAELANYMSYLDISDDSDYYDYY